MPAEGSWGPRTAGLTCHREHGSRLARLSWRTSLLHVVTVRPVTSVDVPGVVALVRETLAEFGLRFGEGSKTDDELSALPGSYEQGGGAFWVAVDTEGNVVGTCGVFPVAPGDMELRKMYLHPGTRGTGLGKRLRGCRHILRSSMWPGATGNTPH